MQTIVIKKRGNVKITSKLIKQKLPNYQNLKILDCFIAGFYLDQNDVYNCQKLTASQMDKMDDDKWEEHFLICKDPRCGMYYSEWEELDNFDDIFEKVDDEDYFITDLSIMYEQKRIIMFDNQQYKVYFYLSKYLSYNEMFAYFKRVYKYETIDDFTKQLQYYQQKGVV